MTFWIGLWKLCLILGLVAFAAMAIVVTVGGASDIRKMISSLREPDESNEE